MFKHFRKKRPRYQLIISIIIGIAVVAFWRGVWGLLDLYLLPENEAMSYLLSIGAGLVILYATHHLSNKEW